jgi:hypothetical protein
MPLRRGPDPRSGAPAQEREADMKLFALAAAALLIASPAFACPYSAQADAKGGQSQIQAGQTQIPQTPAPATDKKG